MPTHPRRTTRRLALAVAALVCTVLVPTGTASADTLVDTGTNWYDNQSFSSGYFAFGFTASGAAQVDGISFSVHGTASSGVSGSSVDIYRDHPTAPTTPANLLGTLAYASIATEGSDQRVSFTGSVTVPAAGTYWVKWRDLTAGQNVWIHFGVSGTPAPWTIATGAWHLNGSENTGSNGLTSTYFPMFRITGSAVTTPTIGAVAPSQGPAAGGTQVVITGTGLGGATAVAFGGTAAASFTIDSATQITAVTPAKTAGSTDVSVTTAGGTATLAGAFTFEAAADPVAAASATTTSAAPARTPLALRATVRFSPDGMPVTSGRVPAGATRVEQIVELVMPVAKSPWRQSSRARTVACPITTTSGIRTFRCAPTLAGGRWRLTTRAMNGSTVIARQVRVVRVTPVPTRSPEVVTG
jgi:hypothetical protein